MLDDGYIDFSVVTFFSLDFHILNDGYIDFSVAPKEFGI